MQVNKVKIVQLNREQMTTLRLMLKLEWMRLTDKAIKQAIAQQEEHTAVTQEIISYGESFIIMDTPLYEGLREAYEIGREGSAISFHEKGFEILHDMIQNRYKADHMSRVPPEIAQNPQFGGSLAMIREMIAVFDQQREGLDAAFTTADEGYLREGGSKKNSPLLN